MARKFITLSVIIILLLRLPVSIAQSMELDPLSMESLLNRVSVTHYLPGSVIGIVKDGEVLYKSATGNSRLNPDEEMDFNNTLLQTGSVSKVFTSYALLKLMEDHGIAPEDEIGTYLDENYEVFKGLTFENILTHTTGIASLRASSAYRESPLVDDRIPFSLEAANFLDAYDLDPVIEKDQYILPSNVNNILQGLLIESISGKSYESMVSEVLINDFQMRTSASVLLGEVPGYVNLAQNYAVYAGRSEPLSAFRTKFLPSDDFLTTGKDMILFMQKITSNISDSMDRALFERKVGIESGRSYALSTVKIGNVDVFLQDGGVPGSTARLMFIPEENMGIFFAYNSDDLKGRDALTHLLFEEIFPGYEIRKEYDSTETVDIERFSGVYSPVNASNETIEKLTKIIHQIRVVSQGRSIVIDKVAYNPIAETLFYSESANQLAEFRVDEEGKLLALIIGNSVYERASIFQSLLLELTLLGLAAFFNLIAWVVFIKKWHEMKLNRIHDTPRTVLMIHTLVNSLLLIFIYRSSTQYAFWDVIYGDSFGFTAIKILGILSIALILPAFYMTKRLKEDFRWNGFMTFVYGIQILLTALVGFWLFLYNFI